METSCGAGELHVLAVDDSLVDRKVIERLLKISSCKGDCCYLYCYGFFLVFWIGSEADWIWNVAVTVVESGTRALEYLGLDGEKSSIGFEVRNLGLDIHRC